VPRYRYYSRESVTALSLLCVGGVYTPSELVIGLFVKTTGFTEMPCLS